MPRPNIRVALVYDFDGTLAPGNMQERDFLPKLGIKPKVFWDEAKALAKAHEMDEILAYMELTLDKCRARNMSVQRQTFVNFGKSLTFFDGVESWFSRINAFGKSLGVSVTHYVISSGLREMIEGTSIRREFTQVFASGFRYDASAVAIWPALAVNYTNKAQYLFRINKGIDNAYDNTKINKYTPEDQRPVPFKNMIYIGDGDTDVPAMKMVTYQGGKSIVVYAKGKGRKTKAHQLVEEERADIAVPADYTKGSILDEAVKAQIRQIAARATFERCDTSPVKGIRRPK